MKKILFVWANSSISTKTRSINAPYHLVRVYEVMDYLEKRGLECELIDMEINGDEFADLMKLIVKDDFSTVVFYNTFENIPNVLFYNDIIKNMKKNEINTITYGEVSTICSDYFLDYTFDGIIKNNCDPEISIMDFHLYSNGKRKKEKVRGVLFLEEGCFKMYQDGEFINPEEWGFSREKFLNYSKLTSLSKSKQITIAVAKGCPYNCSFCLTSDYEGKKLRQRPINQIIDFINENNYDTYKFFAANFTIDKEYVIELCDKIITANKKIRWSCSTRADLLQDESIIKKMAESGCYKISIGVESLYNDNLNNLSKTINYDMIIKSINLVKKYGIMYKALIMFGIPKQTKYELYNTVQKLQELGVVVRPTAYTPLYCLKRGMNPYDVCRLDKYTYYDNMENIEYGTFLNILFDCKNIKKYIGDELC